MRVYTNPVHPGYFADPFVWQVGREYFAIGTGPAEAQGEAAKSRQNSIFPLLRSGDLVHWQEAGHALLRPDAALGDTYWAPEIIYAEGLWHLYYSVGFADRLHQLRVAISDQPLGPYQDIAQLTEPKEVPFAIDPHPFQDADGRMYMFHARDFLDNASDEHGLRHPGTALVVAELESMTRLSKEVRTVQRARCDWQLFAKQRPMYGQVYDWHTLEGPFVIKEGDTYYCIYSGGCWQTETYGVDYTTAKHPLGPWEQVSGQPVPRILRTVPGKVIGPGHCSVVAAPAGQGRVLVYHAWDPDMRARSLRIDPLLIGPEGPRSPGPSWETQQFG